MPKLKYGRCIPTRSNLGTVVLYTANTLPVTAAALLRPCDVFLCHSHSVVSLCPVWQIGHWRAVLLCGACASVCSHLRAQKGHHGLDCTRICVDIVFHVTRCLRFAAYERKISLATAFLPKPTSRSLRRLQQHRQVFAPHQESACRRLQPRDPSEPSCLKHSRSAAKLASLASSFTVDRASPRC